MSRLVKALSHAFYKGRRIREGQVFEVGDDVKLGKWMKEVKASASTAPALAIHDDGKHLAKPVTGDRSLGEMSYTEMLAKAKALGLAYATNPKKDALVADIENAEKAHASVV